MCPIRLAPVSAGVTVTISGLIEVNPEHSNSTAGRVAQGSSAMQSARNAPLVFRKILQGFEPRVVEQIARAHHPADPLQKRVLWQVHAEAGLPGM